MTEPHRTTGLPATVLSVLLLAMTATAQGQDSTVNPADCAPEQAAGNPFPTPVIADYVLACMAANGNTYQSLHQCSCSIDLIASKMSYEDYEQANTILQIQQDKGQRGIFYREANWAKGKVDLLKKLQAESTLTCF